MFPQNSSDGESAQLNHKEPLTNTPLFKLPDKSIASLVKYYYSWKKTRTRSSAAERQEKKKANRSENGSENNSPEDSNEDDKVGAVV